MATHADAELILPVFRRHPERSEGPLYSEPRGGGCKADA
jgi:hypothetical protein